MIRFKKTTLEILVSPIISLPHGFRGSQYTFHDHPFTVLCFGCVRYLSVYIRNIYISTILDEFWLVISSSNTPLWGPTTSASLCRLGFLNTHGSHSALCLRKYYHRLVGCRGPLCSFVWGCCGLRVWSGDVVYVVARCCFEVTS